MRPVAFDLKA